MGLIYQKAERCLIWLGQGPDKAKEYLDAIKELVQIETAFNAADNTPDPISLSPEEKARYNIPHGQTTHLKGLQLILSNPWLTRVWVVQEASLAQQATIHLGAGSVTWEDFVAAQSFASKIGLLHIESEAPINGMLAIRANRFLQDNRLPVKGEDYILSLLARFRNFEASYAEDKVYGLISLLSERHHGQWQVGRGAEQAYLDAAIRIMSDDNSLNLLGIPRLLDPSVHLHGDRPQTVNIPSWVPDWRSNQVPISLRMLEFAPFADTKFATTKDSTYEINCSENGKLLGVGGYRISIIHRLGTIRRYRPSNIIGTKGLMRKRINTALEEVNTYFNWKETVQFCSRQESYPHSATPMNKREAFWKTILASNTTSYTAPIPRLAESFEAYNTMLISIRKRRLLLKLIPLVNAVHTHWLGGILLGPFTPILNAFYSIFAQDPEAQDFCNDMVRSYGRRIATTEDGYFALVPGNAAIGDEIALLKGARAPIVLRKHLEDDKWEHIGEAYVEGLMNGEKWDESLCKRRWLV
jgi:hypothetical protein